MTSTIEEAASPELHGSWNPMDADRARTLAERLHRGQRDAAGRPLLEHVRRVVAGVPPDAHAVAWLHEVFEHSAISEQELLAEGLTTDELRAVRLLSRSIGSRSTTSYLAHVERIARAAGPGAEIARAVKRADLGDRVRHPSTRADGWAPPYALGLGILERTSS